MKRYTEKWLLIKLKLGGEKVPEAHPEVVRNIQEDYKRLTSVWDNHRHKPECDRRTRHCHKVFGCRYSFLNCNYVILSILYRHGHGHKYHKYLPQVKGAKKLSELNTLMRAMYEELGWGKTFRVIKRLPRKIYSRTKKQQTAIK